MSAPKEGAVIAVKESEHRGKKKEKRMNLEQRKPRKGKNGDTPLGCSIQTAEQCGMAHVSGII
jgi:hypothetical protein